MVTAQSDPPDLPGLTYVRRLGSGGYAEVFLYEQMSPRMRVAVKVLFAESLSPRALEQFAAEANTMAELADHPNIVQIFRSDVTADGRPYLVMKYYPQRNLAVRAKSERLSVPEVLRIGVRVACAVETAHRAGILHRDIKPANILTSQYGEPGLTDFGIATTGAEEDVDAEGLSIPWSAPEVVFSKSPGDRSSDVYSLGATLWHLLVGHSPFEEPDGDNSSFAFVRRIREMAPPRSGREDVPPSLERLLAQTMAKNPVDRPQSALHLARSLQAIESEQRWTPTPLVLLETEDYQEAGEAGSESSEEPDVDKSQGSDLVTHARPPVVGSPSGRSPEGDVESDDGPETRRRLVTVSPSTGVREQRSTKAVERKPRERLGMPQLDDDLLTIQRPTAKAQGSDGVAEQFSTDSTSNGSRNGHVGVLLLVVAMVAVVGLSLAVLLGGRHSPGGSTTTTTSGSASAPTIALPQTVNAPTQLTSNRVSPTEVQFTWTIPDEVSSDKVWWVDSGDASQAGVRHFVESNQADVSATGQVCITVFVQQGTAENSSAPYCGG